MCILSIISIWHMLVKCSSWNSLLLEESLPFWLHRYRKERREERFLPPHHHHEHIFGMRSTAKMDPLAGTSCVLAMGRYQAHADVHTCSPESWQVRCCSTYVQTQHDAAKNQQFGIPISPTVKTKGVVLWSIRQKWFLSTRWKTGRSLLPQLFCYLHGWGFATEP